MQLDEISNYSSLDIVLLIDEEDDVIVEADVIFDEEIIVCENDADELHS